MALAQRVYDEAETEATPKEVKEIAAEQKVCFPTFFVWGGINLRILLGTETSHPRGNGNKTPAKVHECCQICLESVG